MRKLYSVLLSFIFITNSFAQVPTNGLVSEWLFDNSSITNGSNSLLAILGGSPTAAFATDRSGNPNSAVNVNPGGFINFAGDEFDAYTTGANAEFAYSFWIKLDAFDNAYRCIMAKASFESLCQIPGRQYAILVTPAGKLQLQAFGSLTGGHARVDGNTTLTVGDWHHIVISVDMATLMASLPATTGLTMYVDGVLQTNNVSEISGSGILPSGIQDGPAHLGFGTYLNTAGAICAGTQNIDAHFDDFRIYNRTLDASDVANLLNDGCEPNIVQVQPQSGSACSGTVSLFCQAFFGTVVEMRWERFNGTTWQDMGNSTTGNSIGISVDNSLNGLWRVKMTRDCGAVVYSDEVVVAIGEPYMVSQTEGTPASPIYLCPANGSVELSVDAVGENITYQWYSAANGFPPLTYTPISGATNPTYDAAPSGNMYYQVEVTACGQVVSSDEIYVQTTVQPTITITNVSSGGTICLGNSANINISATGAQQISWSPNDGTVGGTLYTVSPEQTTTYTVTGTNAISGCFATASTTITVVDPQPVIVENNGVLEITGGTYTNIVWYLNGSVVNGATQATYTPVADGDYTVSVFESNCNGTSDPYSYTGVPTGIVDGAANGLKVYPNPFNAEFIIETTELTSVSVMNAVGEVVLSRTVKGRTSIDATNLCAGIYFVREETSGAVMKLVKN